MSDIATLGIVINGQGARRDVKLTVEELKRLANGGREAQSVLKGIGQPATTQGINRVASVIRDMDRAQRGATFEMGKLRQGMTSLAIASGALPGPLGRIASTLAPLAMGGGVTVGVLAGIAAIGFAWEKLTEQSRKAKEEFQKHLDVLIKLKREQDLGPLGEVGESTGKAKGRLGEIMGQLGGMNAAIGMAGRSGAYDYQGQLERRRAALVKEASELVRLTAAGEKEITRITGDGAAKRESDAARLFTQRMAREREQFDQRAALERGMVSGIAGILISRHDAYRGGIDQATANVGGVDTGFDQEVFRQNLYMLRQEMERLREKTRAAADALAESAQQFKNAAMSMAQAGLGAIAANNRGNFGGVLAGAAGGVLAGSGGGVPGMIAGGVIGFVGGLLGMNSAAKENREAMQREHALRVKLNEQLATAVRNAPSGWFVPPSGLGPNLPPQLPPGQPAPPGTPGNPPGTLNSMAGSTMNIVVNVNGNRSGSAMVTEFLTELRKRANATVGNGGSFADALALMR